MPLDDIFNHFRHCDRASYEVFACQGNEPSEVDVAAFEGEIGFTLPEDFRDFTMSPLGGLYVAVREEFWPRPKLYEVGPFWSFLYGINVFGIADNIPEELDIRLQAAEKRQAGITDIVPFFRRLGDATRYCFNSVGQIIEWHGSTPDDRDAVDESFADFLLRELHDLDLRRQQKLRGEDNLEPTGEIRPEFQKSYANNRPCPECGKPLRSNLAQQCFECGANWRT